MDSLKAQIAGGTIQIKLFIESEEFCKKLFEAIEKDGISIFSPEWGHYPIKNLDKRQKGNYA